MSSIVGLVVLIACANVAMLLLAQAEGRSREISIRLAVGASRWRLVRQLLAEASFLALLIASWVIPLLPALLPPGPDFQRFDVRLYGRVVAVALLTCLGTGLLFGLVPAFEAARTDLMSLIKGCGWESRARFAGHRLLIIGQAALSVVLLTAAVLLARSLMNTQQQRLGFDTDKNMLVLEVSGLCGVTRAFRPPLCWFSGLAQAPKRRSSALPQPRANDLGHEI